MFLWWWNFLTGGPSEEEIDPGKYIIFLCGGTGGRYSSLLSCGLVFEEDNWTEIPWGGRGGGGVGLFL